MATNYIATGEQLDYPAAGAITSGSPVLIGTRLGVPLKSGISGDVIPMAINGIWTLTKNTGASTNWVQGGPVYWDAGTSKVTGLVTGNTLIGFGAEIAGTADATGKVKLLG